MAAIPDPALTGSRIERDGLGWKFMPAEAPVVFGFSRIVERSSELTAELHVQTIGKGNPEHVLRRRVNMLGSRTPSDLAKDLDLSTDMAGWPWRKIVEQAFASIVEEFRSGEVVKMLGGKTVAPPPPAQLIDGLILANTANTWFGPGGTGKSTAAAAACVAHTLAEKFAGLDVPLGVPLYLDWEDEEEAFERMLWQVSVGYGLRESARVHWRRMRAPLKDDIAYISALIDRIGSTLVVIDSATRAMGSPSEHGTYEANAVSFAEAIRSLGKVTTLILDHVDGQTVKDGGVARKSYGSIHKMNFVRNAWSLTPDEDASIQTVGWTHAKVNYIAKLPPFGIRYERDEVLGGLWLARMDGADVAPIAATMTLARKIEATLIRRGVMSLKDLTEDVVGATEKKDVEKIRVTLNRDMGRRFRRYSDGTWSMKDWRPSNKPNTANRPPNIRVLNAADDDVDELPF